MKDGFISLGKRTSAVTEPAPMVKENGKEYFPSIYISDIDEVDIEQGDIVTLKGRVVSATHTIRNGKESCSFEIECTGVRIDEDVDDGDANGLEVAFKKIEKSKRQKDE